MSKWSEFYQHRLNDKYIEHLKTRYDYFLSSIEDHILQEIAKNGIEHPINIIELGAGACNISRILYDRLKPVIDEIHNRQRKGIKEEYFFKVNFIAVEKDKDMIELAKKNIGNRDIKILCHSVLDNKINKRFHTLCSTHKIYKSRHIILSHGLLEHFKDEEIHKVFQYMLYGQKHFHYVPGIKYKEPSFGDERLLSKEDWAYRVLSFLAGHKVHQFNDGFDYMIER